MGSKVISASKINSGIITPLTPFLLCLPLTHHLPLFSFFLLLSISLSPNFTFHLDISQPVTDSCSPPPPDPQLLRPSIRHSAVPRRAGRSRADCTRGLGGVTTPCCLLGACLFDDMTVHLKGKLVLCVQRSVFLWKATYF